MEAMMKDICEGRRTKNDVIQESLHMYQEVFMKANRDVDVLIEVQWSQYLMLNIDVSAIPTGRMIQSGYIGSNSKSILTPRSAEMI